MGLAVEVLPVDGAPQVGITVTGLDPVVSSVISVEVSWDGGESWHGVRGAERVTVTGAGFFRDFVPPLNVEATYRVVVHSGPELLPTVTRRNYVRDPRATGGSAAGWSYQAGTSEAGTTTSVTGASDGPTLPDGTKATTYMRRTVTTAKSSGTSGWYFRSGVGDMVTAAGQVWAGSIYVRLSVSVEVLLNIQQRMGSTAGASTVVSYPAPAGTWMRIGHPDPAEVAGDGFQVWATNHSSVILPVGATYDVTAAQAELGDSVTPYFDGTLTDAPPLTYQWEGAANASASVEMAVVSQDTITVPSDTAWIQDPLDPRGAVAVDAGFDTNGDAWLLAPTSSTVNRGQVYDSVTVEGSRYPVASVGMRQAPSRVPISLRAAAQQGEMVRALRGLFDSSGILVLRGMHPDCPLDPVAHVVAGDIAEAPKADGLYGIYNTWDLIVDQVRPTSMKVAIAYYTYNQVHALWQAWESGASYEDVIATRPGDLYIDWQRDPQVP